MLRAACRAGRAAARAAAGAPPRDAAAAAAGGGNAAWDPLAACAAWLQQRPLLCRGVKTQGNELRSGQVIERDGRLLEIMKADYTQGQGRAGGVVQLEARDLRSGAKRVERVRPAETVERVQLERGDYTFLYAEGKKCVVMQPESFEQLELPLSLFGDAAPFLVEGSTVTLATHAGEVLTAVLPETVEAVVQSCGTSMKNERTDGRQLKPATLANGATLQVPGFVKEGDVVVLRPATGEFVKRKL